MVSPFPGMDPYLEDSSVWPGFHHSFANAIKGCLNERIGPKYYADVKIRTVASPFKLRAVQIYVTESAELVTTIEILSPFNKQKGDGVEEYRRKRRRILESAVHLVEIDLLRGGQRPGEEVAYPPLDTDYVLLVNRADEMDERLSEIWPVALNEALPLLPIPLLPPDPAVPLNMTALLKAV